MALRKSGQVLRRIPAFKADVKPPAPKPTLVISLPRVELIAVARGPAELTSPYADGDAVEVTFLLAGREIRQDHSRSLEMIGWLTLWLRTIAVWVSAS
jgi:hypothetical protein